METPINFDEMKAAIQQNDEYAVGCLIHVYNNQTLLEQDSQNTVESNGVGFSGVDAGLLSSFSQFYQRTGFLTPKQLVLAKAKIQKYHKQILGHGVNPLPIKGFDRADSKANAPTEPVLTADLDSEKIILKFIFPRGDARFKETLAQVKTLHGKRWRPEKKHWTVPLNLMAVKSLMAWGFKLDMKLELWHNSVIIDPDSLVEADPGLKGNPLYPFQNKGINFLERTGGRGIIGDEMGLGKTVQALGWIKMNPDAAPTVIVCPASLKLNWAREIKKWIGDANVFVINGRPTRDSFYQSHQVNQAGKGDFQGHFIILNYEILSNSWIDDPKWKPGMKKKKIEVRDTGWVDFLTDAKSLIIDEYHYIKNSKSARTKAVQSLGDQCSHIIALSGTPMINRPDEFLNGIQLINPQIFPGWHYYVTNFCGAFQDGFGWNTSGATNKKKLHQILTHTIMCRRKKADVLSELPPKTRSVVPLEINNHKEYQAAQNNIIEFIREREGAEKAAKASNAEALVEFEKLKQLAVKGKMEAALKWVKNFLDSGEKLIVFADHKFVIDAVMKKFGKVAVKVDGSTPVAKRMDMVDTFQNDDSCRLFVGSKAAKEGLTLTAASNVAFLELFWTPGDHDQAEDRCYGRLSDLHGAVAWYLIADDTVEGEIAELLDRKREVLAAILDGEDVPDESMLTQLMERMKYAA